jgi:hypothetical protein
MFVVVIAAGCRGSRHGPEPKGFTLEPGKVMRKFGCNVVLENFKNDYHPEIRFACRVPETAITEERWWGDQPKPEIFALDEGDCIFLEVDFFCVDQIAPGKSVSFRDAYVSANESNTVIKRLPRRM